MLIIAPKEGTKIRCVNDGDWSFLTKGKIYEVLPTELSDDSGFFITDDDGDVCWVDETDPEKFELVEKEVEMKESNEITNTKQDDFQVGDVVWDVIYGRGEVTDVDQTDTIYPTEVQFTHGPKWYTIDGRNIETYPRTLFFSEPKIEAAVIRPFVPTLVGKRVVLRYFDGTCSSSLKITDENKDMIWYDDNSSVYKSELTAIYEVQSENLLKK